MDLKVKPMGVVMDPISTIAIQKDSTFAILLAAQKMEWPLFYMEVHDLFLNMGTPYARMQRLFVRDNPKNWFSLSEERVEPLDKLSVILMRKDPPVNQTYMYATHILDRAQTRGVLVVNRPQSLRDLNEKIFALDFPECSPPTLITSNAFDAKEFLREHKDIIVKPLDGMGGASVFRIRENDPNMNVILETLSAHNKRYMVVQRYLPQIQDGDKRILLIDGEPIPYALARIAAPGETRANLAVGGKGIGVHLNERDYWICHKVGSICKAQGLLLVGLDVIGDYLTEINITSPTGIRELENQFHLNISQQLVQSIQKNLV